MRSLFLLTLLLLVHFNLMAQSHIDKISPHLEDKMLEEPDGMLPVYVILEDQVDIVGMHKDFNDRNASLEERTYAVITALQAKSNATQGPLLEYLRSQEKIETESVVGLWITNVIQAKIHTSFIEELSRRDDVFKLEYINKNVLGDHTEGVPSPPSPNGSEPGLLAIKADKLWAMGYTGYGTRSLTIDTGVDYDHPALKTNFHGLYVDVDEAYTGKAANPTDCEGHGTSVTGCIVGLQRNNNDTIGVAFNALWMIGDNDNLEGSCPDADLSGTQNMQWAMNPDGNSSTIIDMPCVVNNSWGSPNGCGNNWTESSAQNALEAAGVAVVWSAGNDGPGANTTNGHADINTSFVVSFSVGSVNGNSASLPISGFSSRGPSSCGGLGALAIKPEVVAPGQNVRTSNTGGGYTFIDGTSFSSPYAAGAILLLKEAFPTLTGEAIKLALYNSATDLGSSGEDNTYGKGIINLESAFNYLVAAGNSPVDPFVQNDALVVELNADYRNCDGVIDGVLTFENGGPSNLTSLVISYSLVDNLGTVVGQNSFNWTGNVEPGGRFDYVLPEITGPDGAFNLVMEVSNPSGFADDRPLNNRVANEVILSQAAPLEIEAFGDTPCNNANTVLFVDFDGGEVGWYFYDYDDEPFATGNYFEAPNLDWTYYVDVNINTTLGEPNNTAEPSQVSNDASNGLTFDAYTDFILKSVKVYYDQPGLRLIQLRDPSGNNIAQKTITLPPGQTEFVVNLDFDIEAASGYVLRLGAGGALYETTNPSFPYNSEGGVAAIVGSADFGAPGNTYYYFYDWQICSKGYVCGRVPYAVNVQGPLGGLSAGFSPDGEPMSGVPLTFNNESQNAVSYEWDFGDGNTSTAETPNHTYTTPGVYTVVLVATNDNGCSDAIFMEITVALGVGIDAEFEAETLKVFPNPAANEVNIQFDFTVPQKVDWYLVDVLGRPVSSSISQSIMKDQIVYNVQNHADGLYYFIFYINGQKIVRKVVVLN